MSSAHRFITEAQIDLVFTFILFPICLGSTLESIPIGCRPTLHWAFSAEPCTKPCRSNRLSAWPIWENFQLASQNFFFFFFLHQLADLDFSGCFLMCNDKKKKKTKIKNVKFKPAFALFFNFTRINTVPVWRRWLKMGSLLLCYLRKTMNIH